MEFCSTFDETLASVGPAAIFLRDPAGELRMNESWTRDAWGRAPGPHTLGRVWVLYRDKSSGYVGLLLCTSPTLLTDHPRLELRTFASHDEANAVLGVLGTPPICADSWS